MARGGGEYTDFRIKESFGNCIEESVGVRVIRRDEGNFARIDERLLRPLRERIRHSTHPVNAPDSDAKSLGDWYYEHNFTDGWSRS